MPNTDTNRATGGSVTGSGPASLAGRRVLIAGASGAIGAAIAAAVADAGARVCLHYHRSSGPAERLAERINAERGQSRAFPAQADLTDREAAENLFDRAFDRLGGVDVLINCIGTARDDSIMMLTERDADLMLRGNLAPVVYLCEAMRRRCAAGDYGRIINITSITGLVGQPMRSLYGAAKGAVIAYTKGLAREIAGRGWTANCIAPQVLDGGIADVMKPQVRAAIMGSTPIKRSCTPNDLVGAALFLASAEAGFITGTVLNVTGGLVTW
jgi:3-oxoacyl-[acyl-carrier protein] reductase